MYGQHKNQIEEEKIYAMINSLHEQRGLTLDNGEHIEYGFNIQIILVQVGEPMRWFPKFADRLGVYVHQDDTAEEMRQTAKEDEEPKQE